MNPIIYFDELDKISDTPKGEEIVGILTHLTDTTQNSNFHDKYFSEIEFDLSKCLFIFSYNDESKINPILKDRMYRIYTQDYNKQQKQVIAQNYLMPKIRETIKFKDDEIIVNNSIIDYINMNYVENEKGVRNMKRCLEIIFMKLNLFRFIDSDSTFFDEQVANPTSNAIVKKKENKFKVTFPLTLTTDLVDKLLKRNKPTDGVPHLYM
jgi:ATP-dependent Lon protease